MDYEANTGCLHAAENPTLYALVSWVAPSDAAAEYYSQKAADLYTVYGGHATFSVRHSWAS